MAAVQDTKNMSNVAGEANGVANASPALQSAGEDASAGRTANPSSGNVKSMPTTRRHSGEHPGVNGNQHPASPAPNQNGGNAASSGARGEESLSATLERLRIDAKRAVSGAQNGGMGPIGHRGEGRSPATASRVSGAKSAHPSSAAAAVAAAQAQAAALARVPSNAGGANDNTNMSNFMFDDELDAEMHSSTYGGKYLQMNTDDDKFPILVRRDSYPGILSASSAALDLAPLSQTPNRNAFARAGPAAGAPTSAGDASAVNGQQVNGTQRTSEWPQFAQDGATGRAGSGSAATGASAGTNGTPSAAARNNAAGTPNAAATSSPRSRVSGAGPARSATTPTAANIPLSATTVSSSNASGGAVSTTGSAGTTTNPPTSAATTETSVEDAETNSPSQMVDSLTASPKRATANGLSSANAGSQQIGTSSPEEIKKRAHLQRERERIERQSAANSSVNPAVHLEGHKFSDGTPSPAARYAGELAALNGTFSPYPIERAGPGGPGNFGGPYGQAGDNYGPFAGRRPGPPGPAGPGGAAAQQQKREEPNRFAGLRLEDLQGDMAALCKDQHGCRFLQKKLEEGNPEHRDMIFAEIYPHFAELMTDSFGNYLSQKLLEHSSDEQRDALLESISGELVTISLNMHGTRAVQKMVDYLSTQRQVQSLIMALNLNVVTLIKDLNGNHVIQKCLNTLPPEDNQFIYNAVAANCIEVATHRHGCCVLQRCIDHASESQRIQLVTEITYNSLTLVLDPFGNYVVQYVLDLNDSRFITAIVNQFRNNVCALSAQKFSSNVVEKCVRVADLEGRKALISELIDRSRLERMLRDSFANYVVQTALDYAEPGQRAELVALIRPVLPLIRNTPYGKRIQSKIQREGFHDGYGRGGYGHPGMYGGMHHHQPHSMGPGGYYGMPHPGAYGPPMHGGHPGQHHGHHPGGPGMHGSHAGSPGPQHYPGGPPGPASAEAYMGRAGPYGGPAPHHYGPAGHMSAAPPHMASPSMSQAFSPNFGPQAVPPMEGGYPQSAAYPYI